MWKRYVSLGLAVLLLSGAALSLGVSREQRVLAEKLIRLHVVAASDDPADQARKLAVRDALLPRISVLTASCPDAESAAAVLSRNLPALERVAAGTLGTGEPVRVSLTREDFPRRDYRSFSLPAGPYRALRVTLGAGQGHNWWCVAFPALCLPAGAEWERQALESELSPEELELVTRDSSAVRFKFRLLDWLAPLLG